jgi:hypothetical protein
MKRLATTLCSALAAVALLTHCGGGGDNPVGNPPLISNPNETSGQKLSFIYFQNCINPIFVTPLQVNINGVVSTNTCASSGCHDNASGTGGAFRVVGSAAPVDLANAANTPDVVRASDIYKNFVSSQGSTVIGSAAQSRLLNKPLVQGVLHGGGLIFLNDQDPNVRLLRYWISRPMPEGQDEFSAAGNALFTPANPTTGACNTQ